MMSQSLRKKSNPAATPSSINKKQPSGTVRPRKCHLCGKMIASHLYNSHNEHCFRYQDEQKQQMTNKQGADSRVVKKSPSILEEQDKLSKQAQAPKAPKAGSKSLSTTNRTNRFSHSNGAAGNKVLNTNPPPSRNSHHTANSNNNTNSNTSNTTSATTTAATTTTTLKKGLQKNNIINPSIATRKYPHYQNNNNNKVHIHQQQQQQQQLNPEQQSQSVLFQQDTTEGGKEESTVFMETPLNREDMFKKKKEEVAQYLYISNGDNNHHSDDAAHEHNYSSLTNKKPNSRNVRLENYNHLRIQEQQRRMANLYNQNPDRIGAANSKKQPNQKEEEKHQTHGLRMSMSSQSQYQSSQLIQSGQNWRNDQEVDHDEQGFYSHDNSQVSAQREKYEHKLKVQMERERLKQEASRRQRMKIEEERKETLRRQRERQMELQRDRINRREREIELEEERQRLRARQMQREQRQREIERQMQEKTRLERQRQEQRERERRRLAFIRGDDGSSSSSSDQDGDEQNNQRQFPSHQREGQESSLARQREYNSFIQRQRQRDQQEERRREEERVRVEERQAQQESNSSVNSQEVISLLTNPQAGIAQLVNNTTQIIDFIEGLGFQDEVLQVMVAQLRQLNAIATQVHELNGLGRNLGFRMGHVFGARIQQLQNAIMNQIGVLLIRNFSSSISQDFQRIVGGRVRVTQGFSKQEIEVFFPQKIALTENQCSICLESYKRGDMIKQLQCRHTYHPICIDEWLVESRKCPMCRTVQNVDE